MTNKFLRYTGKLRYGLSSEKLYASFSATIPLKNSSFMINTGSDALNINDHESISQLANAGNSLFWERNLLKLYESRFANLSFSKPLGSVKTSISTEWSNRRSLQNTSDYTARDLAKKDFTSNNPLNPGSDLPMFPENQALKLKLSASYAFSNDYATYPSGKFYRPSKYPSLGVHYEMGVKGIFGSDVDYSRISVDLTKSNIKLGLLGNSAFYLGAGKFLSTNNLFFTDYKHFLGTRTLFYTPYLNSFLFLDYYKYSTNDQYWEAHFEHNFSGFLFNKLPLLRKLKLNEIAGFNYLGTPGNKLYSEFYLGISFLNFRASYGWSYLNGKKNYSDFRLATGL